MLLILILLVQNIFQKKFKTSIGNKIIKINIFRVQAYHSIMCGYFCIGFIDFMLEGKTLTEYTNLFPPNKFKKTDDIILNCFYGQYIKWNHIV